MFQLGRMRINPAIVTAGPARHAGKTPLAVAFRALHPDLIRDCIGKNAQATLATGPLGTLLTDGVHAMRGLATHRTNTNRVLERHADNRAKTSGLFLRERIGGGAGRLSLLVGGPTALRCILVDGLRLLLFPITFLFLGHRALPVDSATNSQWPPQA